MNMSIVKILYNLILTDADSETSCSEGFIIKCYYIVLCQKLYNVI